MNPSFSNESFHINVVESQEQKFISKERLYYPKDFKPRDADVIMGKGMKNFNHTGNQMLREVVASRLSDYAFATSKKERSNVISLIMEHIQMNGSFVQKDARTNLWFVADEFLARDKVSQILRSILYQKKRNVKSRRKIEKKASQKPDPLESLSFKEVKELVMINARAYQCLPLNQSS